MGHSTWNVDPIRILTRREIAAVLCNLMQRSAKSCNARLNRTVFRLACCCGLRVSEIANLRLSDVHVEGGRPHLHIRPEGAKGGRRRNVALWWDQGTLDDIALWKGERQALGAKSEDHFVCCLRPGRYGEGLIRHTIRERFRTACKPLGLERLKTLTIHHGRHTFISHALAGGRTLAEVRIAAGHGSLMTTSAYLHVAVDDDGKVGNLFDLLSDSVAATFGDSSSFRERRPPTYQ